MITLRQLRYLASLARHRHFGRAAEDCAVTQPALSMQIREFERGLGVDLIERRPGDIALTDTGLEVAARAEQILTAVRDLTDFAQHRAPLAGSLKLGVIPTFPTMVSGAPVVAAQLKRIGITVEIENVEYAVWIKRWLAKDFDLTMNTTPGCTPRDSEK